MNAGADTRLPVRWMAALTFSVGCIVIGAELMSPTTGLRRSRPVGKLVAVPSDGEREWRIELLDPRASPSETLASGTDGAAPLVCLASRRRSDFGLTAPIFRRRMVLVVLADDADRAKYPGSGDLALLVREAIERRGPDVARDSDHLRMISESIDTAVPWHQDLDPFGIASNAFVLAGLLGGAVSLWRIHALTRIRPGARP